MPELMNGAPPYMTGAALLILASAWGIREAGPELRQWADRRRVGRRRR